MEHRPALRGPHVPFLSRPFFSPLFPFGERRTASVHGREHLQFNFQPHICNSCPARVLPSPIELQRTINERPTSVIVIISRSEEHTANTCRQASGKETSGHERHGKTPIAISSSVHHVAFARSARLALIKMSTGRKNYITRRDAPLCDSSLKTRRNEPR